MNKRLLYFGEEISEEAARLLNGRTFASFACRMDPNDMDGESSPLCLFVWTPQRLSFLGDDRVISA
ncbi:MAG: hypothetical protein K6A64_09295 [Bacteroidales bacterium]|nr:hypothetical protein [Bacteroidales bacterium]